MGIAMRKNVATADLPGLQDQSDQFDPFGPLCTSNPDIARAQFHERVNRLHAAGLALLPSTGKRPKFGYRALKRRPSPAAIIAQAERAGVTDLVIVPGLSKWKIEGQWHSLLVVDCDDHEAVTWAVCMFGWTPFQVATRRGQHLYYRVPCWTRIPTSLTNLRNLEGVNENIDLKHGYRGAVVVAPGSQHPDATDFIYSMSGCSLDDMRNLPVFPVQVLERVTGTDMTRHAGPLAATATIGNSAGNSPWVSRDPQWSEASRAPAAAPHSHGSRWGGPAQELRGSRKLGLNQYLCGMHASGDVTFASEEQVLDEARRLNATSFASHPGGELPDAAVGRVAREVWEGVTSGRVGARRGNRIRTMRFGSTREAVPVLGAEWDLLNAHGQLGRLAYFMLHKFYVEHHARQLRGETFAIACHAMVEAGTILEVNVKSLRAARDLLLDLGLIERVSAATNSRLGRAAAQYSIAAAGSVVMVHATVETVTVDGEVVESKLPVTTRYLAKHGGENGVLVRQAKGSKPTTSKPASTKPKAASRSRPMSDAAQAKLFGARVGAVRAANRQTGARQCGVREGEAIFATLHPSLQKAICNYCKSIGAAFGLDPEDARRLIGRIVAGQFPWAIDRHLSSGLFAFVKAAEGPAGLDHKSLDVLPGFLRATCTSRRPEPIVVDLGHAPTHPKQSDLRDESVPMTPEKLAARRAEVDAMIAHPGLPAVLQPFLLDRRDHFARYTTALRNLLAEVDEAVVLGAEPTQVADAISRAIFSAASKFEGTGADGRSIFTGRDLDAEGVGKFLGRVRTKMSLGLGQHPTNPVRLERYAKDLAAIEKVRRYSARQPMMPHRSTYQPTINAYARAKGGE